MWSIFVVMVLILPLGQAVNHYDDHAVDLTKEEEDICTLPPKSGRCRARIPVWYYAPYLKSCQTFGYGGCDRNENRFETEEACKARCVPKDLPVDKCTLPPVTGRYKARFLKWHYDPATRTCKQFVWGGCGGNANRFDSISECRGECDPCFGSPKCPEASGSLLTCQAFWSGWYYDTSKQECVNTSFSGCGTCGKNFYTTARQCSDTCQHSARFICKLPKEVGPCDALIRSWYYNKDTAKCEQFFYGGCEGNENRFATKKDCRKMCDKCSGYNPAGCARPPLDPDTNVCLGFYFSWYYDSSNNTCQSTGAIHHCPAICSMNIYGTEVDCQDMCAKNICTDYLPDSGPCSWNQVCWYFDEDSASCKSFTWGGCGGNPNRFSTFEECERFCHPCSAHPQCILDLGDPICQQEYSGFYYSDYTQQCESVSFTSCLPCSRNFYLNVRDCERKCEADADEGEPDKCTLKPVSGLCLAYFSRWYYDPQTRKCKSFIYGGCGGNDNRFDTKAECREACDPCYGTPICNIPPGQPICAMLIMGWYFNTNTNQCEYIQFGGCRPCGKNFYGSEAEC